MPSSRLIGRKLYILHSFKIFSGDKDREVARLTREGYSVRVFQERHVGDNTGVYVLYVRKR